MRIPMYWMGLCLVWSVFAFACDDNVTVNSRCGDNYIDPGEVCDGTEFGGATCESLGYYNMTGVLGCTGMCELDTTDCGHRCGDGLLDIAEDCDDGDNAALDGCDDRCRIEDGWSCTSVSPAVCTPICGDGQILGEENCEGGDLGGVTCETLGYEPGALACGDDCRFDTTQCGEIIGRVADHTVVPQFELIPQDALGTVVDNLNVYFGHTSHGSQLVTGMGMLDPLVDHSQMNLTEEYGDLGTEGDLAWEGLTRTHLGAHPETNVVIWSWCGGQSTNTVQGVQTYLDAMNQLEEEFPDVAFIYMTGHLDGTGDDGLLRENNRQIREWCMLNGKLLFDFEDIESWDPAGEYYADGTDACEWCSEWMIEHPEACPDCADSCAHSHCFNCYQKGKAFWWLLARIAGWNG